MSSVESDAERLRQSLQSRGIYFIDTETLDLVHRALDAGAKSNDAMKRTVTDLVETFPELSADELLALTEALATLTRQTRAILIDNTGYTPVGVD